MVKVNLDSPIVFSPAVRVFAPEVLVVKLPVPVEDFEAFAIETNDRSTSDRTTIFNNLIFSFISHRLGILITAPLLGAPHQTKTRAPKKEAQAFAMMTSTPPRPERI